MYELTAGSSLKLLHLTHQPLLSNRQLRPHVYIVIHRCQGIIQSCIILALDAHEQRPVGGEGVEEGIKNLQGRCYT
jgi:hypothetical protein